jgi:hypothetical protein
VLSPTHLLVGDKTNHMQIPEWSGLERIDKTLGRYTEPEKFAFALN